jgi:hypothetical protein
VELARTLDPEDTDVGPLAHNPPEVQPLALTLQVSGVLVLKRAKAFDLFRINPCGGLTAMRTWNSKADSLVSENWNASPTPGPLALDRIDQSAATGLAPVSACKKTSAYSDADCWFCPVRSLPSFTT